MKTVEKIGGYIVEFVHDADADAPWENCDGHGTVRKSRNVHVEGRSDKKPGERPLNCPDRNEYQFYYDWQEATQIAKRDGWNNATFDAPNRVQRAVQADFDYLRGWIYSNWVYVGVIVKDDQGNTLNSLWGVETLSDYHVEVAQELVSQCRNTVSIDVFPYRSRGGGNVDFLLDSDVKPWLISHGYLTN